MDSKDEGIYSIYASKELTSETKQLLVFPPQKISMAFNFLFIFYFASTFSKLQQITNQLAAALPSTGHLGAPPPTSRRIKPYKTFLVSSCINRPLAVSSDRVPQLSPLVSITVAYPSLAGTSSKQHSLSQPN